MQVHTNCNDESRTDSGDDIHGSISSPLLPRPSSQEGIDDVVAHVQESRHGTNAILTFSNSSSLPLLQQSTNVMLVYHLNDLRRVATLNLCLALLCLVYCGVNIGLILVNYCNSQAEFRGEEEVVNENVYHRVEFWATFCFAVVECASLVVGGNRSGDILTQQQQQTQNHQSTKSLLSTSRDDSWFLKVVLFLNIVATWVPAMLVTLNLEVFEIVSHEVEYLNELTMTVVDLVLLKRLLNWNTGRFVLTCVAGMVACVQLGVYNLMGRREDGDMVGEVPAHFLEFAFEIVSSMIAFWFCMDNKSVAEHAIHVLLYGGCNSRNNNGSQNHGECELCNEDSCSNNSNQSVKTICVKDVSPLIHSSQSVGTSYGSMSNV